MNRKKEQAEMLFKLGQFLGPALKMAESPANYDADERTRIMARLYAEVPLFTQAVNKFMRGESGHYYSTQEGRISFVLNQLQGGPAYQPNFSETDLYALIRNAAGVIQDNLLAVPIPIDSTIHEARTPFSTYCFAKDLCSTVKKQVVWLDRYFDQTIFHRFFIDTPKSAHVTLVTLPVANLKGKADQQRHSEFMDISRLFAAERGPGGYRLIENASFHDRWLRCDDRLFTLGGSIKDLTKPFTISRLDSSADNLKQFDDATATGTEAFGAAQPTHP
jgi:hypothetical protein